MTDRTHEATVTSEIHDFINRLVTIKADAGRLGLYRTMQAIDTATLEVGFEVGSKLDPKEYERGERYKRLRNAPKVALRSKQSD